MPQKFEHVKRIDTPLPVQERIVDPHRSATPTPRGHMDELLAAVDTDQEKLLVHAQELGSTTLKGTAYNWRTAVLPHDSTFATFDHTTGTWS